ncbi:hypothetical protein [Salarchaeum japonicum]|uniref:Cox cluster protein n=1 Tax=Salarchaeum japonicum TaxID=555573 RepID=A0AAV3T4A8_9EURY|nr:hypothetical protein [Salarchaeum japonicum]
MPSSLVVEALRTAAYAAYFPLLLVALVVAPAALVELGVPLLDAVEYALAGVAAAYVAGLGVLLR